MYALREFGSLIPVQFQKCAFSVQLVDQYNFFGHSTRRTYIRSTQSKTAIELLQRGPPFSLHLRSQPGFPQLPRLHNPRSLHQLSFHLRIRLFPGAEIKSQVVAVILLALIAKARKSGSCLLLGGQTSRRGNAFSLASCCFSTSQYISAVVGPTMQIGRLRVELRIVKWCQAEHGVTCGVVVD